MMNTKYNLITNDDWSVGISSLGAELKSFKNRCSGKEFIWEGNPRIWKGTAPILFPIVGRLKNGFYLHNNKQYQLDKHGFARTSVFRLIHDVASEKRFLLCSSPETETSYPFKFELEAAFILKNNMLSVEYSVRNIGVDTMYFSLGSHPAFALPTADCELSDYVIEFEKEETLDRFFLENNLLSNDAIPRYLDRQRLIPLSKKLFDSDALIFKDIQSRQLSLSNSKTPFNISLSWDAPHFGIWSKSGASFVCLEPWFSYDDSPDSDNTLSNKPGMISLAINNEFKSSYQITIVPY